MQIPADVDNLWRWTTKMCLSDLGPPDTSWTWWHPHHYIWTVLVPLGVGGSRGILHFRLQSHLVHPCDFGGVVDGVGAVLVIVGCHFSLKERRERF